MRPTRYFFMDEPSRAGWARPARRTDARHDRGERAAAVARDLLGSWSCLGAMLILVIAGAAMAGRHDQRADPFATLILLVSGLTLAAVSLVLMATRRLDRINDERACHDRGSARRSQAVSEEILGQIEQINSGLARLTARVEVLHIRCRAAGDGP
jgi:uncharacterized membrane protein